MLSSVQLGVADFLSCLVRCAFTHANPFNELASGASAKNKGKGKGGEARKVVSGASAKFRQQMSFTEVPEALSQLLERGALPPLESVTAS